MMLSEVKGETARATTTRKSNTIATTRRGGN
jgi:hypothetical protein